MARRTPVLLIVLSFLLTLAPATAQADPEVVLRLEGHEGPLECDPTALDLLCFKTIEGNPAAAFVAGKTVRVELTAAPMEGAPGGAPHNLAVAMAGEQGLTAVDSSADDAIAVSGTAASGETVTLEFTVPGNGTLYFWCDVGEHEFLGMNFTADVQPAPAVETAANDTTDDATDNTTSAADDASGDAAGDDGGADATEAEANTTTENTTNDPADAPEAVEESPGLPLLSVLVLGLVSIATLRRRLTG